MNNIEKFKNIIRFIVSIFASREFGFIYCIIGTLAQCAHTYYLVESVSSLDGFGKSFQALGLSIFISSSLLFFTAIAQGKDKYGNYESQSDKRIHLAVNLFMWIEIIINLYYYAAHLLLTNGLFVDENAQWFNFIFAIIISCMIPVTIKLYAGIIQAKEWLEMLSKQDESLQQINNQDLITKQKLDDFKSQILEDVKNESNKIFEQGTEQFLSKFENKVSTLNLKQTQESDNKLIDNDNYNNKNHDDKNNEIIKELKNESEKQSTNNTLQFNSI